MHRINTLLAIAVFVATAGILPTASATDGLQVSRDAEPSDPLTCEIRIITNPADVWVIMQEECAAPTPSENQATLVWVPISEDMEGSENCTPLGAGQSSQFPFFYVIIREECLIGPMNESGVGDSWEWRWQY